MPPRGYRGSDYDPIASGVVRVSRGARGVEEAFRGGMEVAVTTVVVVVTTTWGKRPR